MENGWSSQKRQEHHKAHPEYLLKFNLILLVFLYKFSCHKKAPKEMKFSNLKKLGSLVLNISPLSYAIKEQTGVLGMKHLLYLCEDITEHLLNVLFRASILSHNVSEERLFTRVTPELKSRCCKYERGRTRLI